MIGSAAWEGGSAAQPRFPRYAWGVLAFTLATILWGAYVRATGSGAGCRDHWPLCDGQVIPWSPQAGTLIEFTHRASTVVLLLLIAGLVVWSSRAYPGDIRVRRAAVASLVFTLGDALIGAGLVLYRLVEQNASAYRAVAMSAHLANTFLLLAALTLTAWYASGGRQVRLRGQGAVGWALGLGFAATMLLGISGAVTALGDTLFPARTLAQGLAQDLSPTAHFLIRLRLLHPLIAMSVGLYLALAAGVVSHLRRSTQVLALGRGLGLLLVAQIMAGFANVLLLAPIWLQMVHLLLADLLWICLVLLSAAALATSVPRTSLDVGPAVVERGTTAAAERATLKDYIALTKPRVISLLLFTTLAAMFIAAGGWPGGWLLLLVAIGGYMAAGAANAINMVIDRDIDGRMRRTAKRPTVTARIRSRDALLFALLLAVGSFGLLWSAANLLAAMMALAGLLFYVIVYTLLLKRRTWHNIVIGGAAGAFPPLVGWAAVTGSLNALAWCLFAIIFVWTPVHFWALALLMKDDYARAGVPMLPCVLGERVTVLQITLYAALTAVISAVPLALRDIGPVYLAAAALLNVALVVRSLQLYVEPGRPRALSLYKYSMAYLALLFLAMAIDRSVHL